jgi:AcrR family transcriptional regulator
MSTSARGRPKRAYHHADLRPALLAAARRMLERDDPAALSLREVARRAGVSHNAPYRHFADRAALLAALAAEGFDALTARMRDAAGAAMPARRLAASGAAYVRFALDEPNLFGLMFGGLVRGRDHPALAAAGARAYSVLQAESGAAPEAGPRAVAAWAMVHGLAHLLLDEQIPAVRGDRAAAERLIAAILGGAA